MGASNCERGRGDESAGEQAPSRGTRQALNLGDVAARVGVARVTAKRWWLQGRLIGRLASCGARQRVVVPVEVVDYYLRYFELPTKRDLFVAGVLDRDFLLELSGPDGGLSEL